MSSPRWVAALWLAGGASAAAAPGDVVRSFSTPMNVSYPAGVAWDGSSLWIANLREAANPNGVYALYKVHPVTGALLGQWSTAPHVYQRLTWDGANLWAIDNWRAARQLDAAGAAIATHATTTFMHGIAWDFGRARMWELEGMDASFNPSRALRRRTAAFAIEATVQTTATHQSWFGLAYDGCTLWTSDLANARLLRLDPVTGVEVGSLAAPVGGVEGVCFDGQYLWVSSTATDKLYQVEVGPPPVGCAIGPADAGPAPDAGAPVADAGPAVDAGGPRPGSDAGVPAADAGLDAGSAGDAGAPVADAGPEDSGVPRDAGEGPDAGLADAALPSDVGGSDAQTWNPYSDAGGTRRLIDRGGCDCGRGGGTPALLTVIALEALRRRRRGRTTPDRFLRGARGFSGVSQVVDVRSGGSANLTPRPPSLKGRGRS